MKLSSTMFKALFETASHAIVVIDEKGVIKNFNPAATRLFLYPASEVIGKNINILINSPDIDIHQYLKTQKSDDDIDKGQELVAQRHDGVLVNIFISISEAKLRDKKYFIAIITNIDEIFGMRKSLRELATFDILTKAYSRSYFETHAAEWFTSYQQNQKEFSLLMLDLNNFKNVNDELGHAVGDEVLMAFSQRMKSCLGSYDYLVRLGGDEFLIIMEGDKIAAHELASRLLSALEEPYDLKGNHIIVTPSIGVYAEAEAIDLSRLLQRADFALYAAKKSTRYIQFFNQHLEENFYHQRYIEHTIRNALAQPEAFYLVFQPQVNILNKKIIGFEALMRLKNEKANIRPQCFIPLIETMGLGEKLNEMLLEKLLNLLEKFYWKKRALKKTKIAFNLSPQVHQLQEHLQNLLKKIKNFSQKNKKIFFEIEITESKLMATDAQYPKQWAKISTLLKKNKVNLAIDDFAREYSSIHRLLEYPVNSLKIDKTFINKLGGMYSNTAESIIKALTTLGKELDITIIAENVEKQEQAMVLKSLKCTVAQGYYFFRPLSPEEAFKLIDVERNSGDSE